MIYSRNSGHKFFWGGNDMNTWAFIITLLLMEISAILGFLLSIWYLVTVWKDTKKQITKASSSSKKITIIVLKILGSFISIVFFFFFIFFGTGNNNGNYVFALEGSQDYKQNIFNFYFSGILQSTFIFIALLVLAAILIFIKLISRSSDHKINWDDNQPFIFYLRSFATEKQTKRILTRFLIPIQTEEEALVGILDRIAPVIAIGNPSEKYSPHGATRVYLTNEEWKEKVAEFATKSKFVVLRLGETQNFIWEMSWCFANIDLQKLLFVIPINKTNFVMNELIKNLQENGVQIADLANMSTMSTRGTITGFLYFDQNDQAIFSALRTNWLIAIFARYDDLLREQLTTFLSRFGKVKKARFVKLKSILVICSLLIIQVAFLLGINLAVQYDKFPDDLGVIAADSEILTHAYHSTSYKTLSLEILHDESKGLDRISKTKKDEIIALELKIKSKLSDWETKKLLSDSNNSDQYYSDWLILCKKYFSEKEYKLYLNDLIEIAEKENQ